MLSAVEKVALGPVAEGAKASTQERATIDTIIEDFMLIIDLWFAQVECNTRSRMMDGKECFQFSSLLSVVFCVRMLPQ
jgi:hypothetical protein